jgi:eukaryotic-like serine/threonine-protein kinase
MELGAYRLISRLGAGGMGEVWRAEDTKLLRQVAIKILPEALAKDPEWKERFLREARTIAQLNHPNIATIYAIDQQADTLFIAMELVEGEPLSALIGRGPMAPTEAVRVAAQVAEGLSEAHSKGIVHRDIKPDNILLSRRVVKVLDFGIAKQIGTKVDRTLTQGGMVVGTPHYMSPEQALGRPVDHRTDIFSLGSVLYEMLSGEKPFAGDAVTEILLQIVMSEPRDIADLVWGINPVLADIVRRAMRKQPEDRFADCEEMRLALINVVGDDSGRNRAADTPTINYSREDSRPPTQPAASPQTARSTAPRVPTEVAKPAKPATAEQPAQPRFRALVADDDPSTRFILGSILSRHRIAFDEAENGAEAVKFLKSHEYKLVFIDLLMPRIDGWGVIDYLRSRRGTQPPRIFIITGVQNQKLSTADQDIVSGLLYKPIDVSQVEKLVS